MSYFQGQYPILHKENLSKGCYSLVVRCPEIAAAAAPGQFVHIRVEGFSLRRPISLCEIDAEAGIIRLVFEIRGDGTRALANLNEGGMIDLLGPLGKGFSLLGPGKKAIVVGGGIGVPPLLEVAKRYGGKASAVIGFRSASAVILDRDFAGAGAEVLLCTDDGTLGRRGFVTEALAERLEREEADIVCACGPMPMLKGVVAIAERYGIRCEVSLEERMGCGVGACLVCACRTVKDGRKIYSHVCKDGPVFDAKEVLF